MLHVDLAAVRFHFHGSLLAADPVEVRTFPRRFARSSASVGNGTPSSRAFNLMIGLDRFKAADARKVEAPEATRALNLSRSSSVQRLDNIFKPHANRV